MDERTEGNGGVRGPGGAPGRGLNDVTRVVIGAAIDVHRVLGPGLLESAYEECLAVELTNRGIPFGRQVPIPLLYKGHRMDCTYRVDLLVDFAVAVEVKSAERLLPIHDAQLLTYLRLGGWPVGLLLNFNVPVLREGIRRMIANGTIPAPGSATAANGYPGPSPGSRS